MMVVVILSITNYRIDFITLQIVVTRIEKTFQLGMYLILVFVAYSGFNAPTSGLCLESVWSILFLFITWCISGFLVLHIVFLQKCFRIVPITFFIYIGRFHFFSSPFVPLVANALKNKDVIVTGITGE